MTTILDLILAALVVSYFIGAIEAFINMGKFKGFVSLLLSIGVFALMGYTNNDLAIMSPAGAFLSLAVMVIIERPVSIQTTRR
jgi:ABC-type bacteriocin/lantibiotic exporter with double-glycine peptidase domain